MDPNAKRKLLRHIPCGLYVLGIKSGSELHGFTASWMSQISMDPPCVIVGVRADSHSLEMLKKGGVFTVNYIRKENKKTLEHFFKPASGSDGRLGTYPFAAGRTGAPILDEAVGYLECEVKKIVEGFGDHAAVIGQVVEASVKDDVPPLIMSDTPWHYGG